MKAAHAASLTATALLGLGVLSMIDTDGPAPETGAAPASARPSPGSAALATAPLVPAAAAPSRADQPQTAAGATPPVSRDDRSHLEAGARAALQALIRLATADLEPADGEPSDEPAPGIDLDTALYVFLAEHPDHGPALLFEALQEPALPLALRVTAVGRLGDLHRPEVEAALLDLLAPEHADDALTAHVYLALAASPLPGPRVLEQLRRDVADADVERARWAIAALGVLAAGAADDAEVRALSVDALLGLLPGSEPERAEALLLALASANEERALPVVLQRTRAASAVERVAAARALGALRSPEGAARLLELARDDADPGVRRAALHGLAGASPTADGLSALGVALRDPEVGVRLAAVEVLTRWRTDVEAGTPLAEGLPRLLREVAAGDADTNVRDHAAQALASD